MIKGLYGFTSACALIMTIALIPEYVGIIPGAMIFLCGGLFTFLVIKIIEEEQKAGGESSQNLWPPDPGPGQIPGRSWTRVIYFQGRRCQSSQIYFIRWVSPNLNKKARLKHRVFFFTRRVARAGSQVTVQVASAGHKKTRTKPGFLSGYFQQSAKITSKP